MTPSDLLDATFAALADSTRRAILARLACGEASVMELAKPFAMSQPAISKHLKALERAGPISRRRDAQRRPCRIEGEPLAGASAWLDGYRQFWQGSFQRLDTLLGELKLEERKRRRTKRHTKRWRRSPMKNTGTMTIATPSDREIVMTRIFDPPRDLIFDALTKPELVRRWLGPRGWSLAVCEIDLRVGGAYRFVGRGSSGTDLVGWRL